MPAWTVLKQSSRAIQIVIFPFPFYRSRFATAWPHRKPILAEGLQETQPQTLSFLGVFFELCDLCQSLGKLTERIQAPLKTHALQFDSTFLGRLGHQPAQQIVGGEKNQQLFMDGLGALAAEILH